MPQDDAWIWDASATLAALGGGEAALWVWSPAEDCLRLAGAVRALGLSPLAPDASGAALRAIVLPEDRHLADELLQVRPAGAQATARLRVRGAEACVWRGAWQEDGRLMGFVSAESRTARAELDPLTGLPDRQSFIRLARLRLETPGPQQLMVADLDRLRRLNEALGHERADRVLAALASRLAAALPPQALAARIGEDEFAVLCPASLAPAETVLRRELERPVRIAGLEISPKLSMASVDTFGGLDAPEATELLRRAELKLEAVRAARSPFAVVASRADGLSRLALENELPAALARGEFTAFYQPIVRLGDGALVGFEALARWRHPRRGLLLPEVFLSVCEEMGLMGELGVAMRGQAARQLAAWRAARAAAAKLTVSVNLSAGELDLPGLPEQVMALRHETGLPAGALKLEVTESEVMRDPEGAAVTLQKLRDAGLRLALDDFGVGFSSLAYLTRLPFDTLKIDGWFVRNLDADPGASKIVASIIALGEDLGLEVVAEGVERSELARRLQTLGCAYAQGFVFARALAPESAGAYVARAEIAAATPYEQRAAG
jgi:c-di-GMP-specific phosphodiesterase